MKKTFPKSNLHLFLWCAFLAIVPRLPFIFHNTAFPTSDSANMLRAGMDFLHTGIYAPSRRPGSFIYDLALALAYTPFQASNAPFFYFTNMFTAICTAITLYFFYKIFANYFPPQKALAAMLLFNFWPREFTMGGGTADINFLLMWMTISFYFLVKKQPYIAFYFALLGVSARLQGVSLAFPIAVSILFDRYKQKEYKYLIRDALLFLTLTLLTLYPMLQANGLETFVQPYHKDEFTRSQLVGAFILRVLNMFGPIGIGILLAYISKRFSNFVFKINTKFGFILLIHTIITLCAMFKAPWETYYLLPLVPLGVYLFFSIGLTRTAQAAFVLSYILPLAVQLQFKPWKVPPYDVRPGVINTQWHEHWIFWGGG